MSRSIRTIKVNTSPAYDVHIGSGLLRVCGEYLREIMPLCRMVILSDSTVAPLYLDTVANSLQRAGFAVSSYVFPAGEAHKNFDTLSDILEFLAEERMTRTDCIVALGGGVTGDMAGFAAGWQRYGDRAQALRLGVACGSATACCEGLADSEGVEQMLAKMPEMIEV